MTREIKISISKKSIIKLLFVNNNIRIYFQKEVFLVINKVEISGVNTARLPVITAAEKDELFIKIKRKVYKQRLLC